MVPALRARQEATEEAGRLLDESSREFIDAGFYRILQPRRFGGYEFSLPTFSRVAIQLASMLPVAPPAKVTKSRATSSTCTSRDSVLPAATGRCRSGVSTSAIKRSIGPTR